MCFKRILLTNIAFKELVFKQYINFVLASEVMLNSTLQNRLVRLGFYLTHIS